MGFPSLFSSSMVAAMARYGTTAPPRRIVCSVTDESSGGTSTVA